MESVKTSTAWKEKNRVICGLLSTRKEDVAEEGTDVLKNKRNL